jgi:hypothetical protein
MVLGINGEESLSSFALLTSEYFVFLQLEDNLLTLSTPVLILGSSLQIATGLNFLRPFPESLEEPRVHKIRLTNKIQLPSQI